MIQSLGAAAQGTCSCSGDRGRSASFEEGSNAQPRDRTRSSLLPPSSEHGTIKGCFPIDAQNTGNPQSKVNRFLKRRFCRAKITCKRHRKINKRVKARFWPCLSGNHPEKLPHCSLFSRKRYVRTQAGISAPDVPSRGTKLVCVGSGQRTAGSSGGLAPNKRDGLLLRIPRTHLHQNAKVRRGS